MKEEFDKLAAAGKINRSHIDALVLLTKSGYCTHRSWGFGKIKTVDTVFARFTIDFQSKAGHAMDLGFAAESLKPIDAAHILARKAADLEGLRQMAALHHLELIKLVVESMGGRATIDQIQQVLVPDVIRDDWKKWWEAAKREIKKDGHFTVPTKKSDPIIYQSKEVALPDRLLAEFQSAKGLKAKTAAATEALKNFADLDDKAALAADLIAGLNADIVTHQRTQPAVTLEGIFIRDEIRLAAELPADEADEVASATIWNQDNRLGTILEQMPAIKHRRALQSFKESNQTLWHEVLLNTLNFVAAKLAGEIALLLIQEGRLNLLKENLAKMISHHTASSELLLWLAKERSDSFADILGPEVFRAMLSAMERDQFNEKKSNRLRDFILDDQDLLVELIGGADFEVIKDLTRALQLSPCFDDMDKRSLLARIVKSYPAVQSLISGETKQDSSLVVSWESLEKRKNEYTELVQKKIPANSKEIAIARSYGDLRENHEYKAAKEMQKILMRRKSELEAQLVRSRGTDFANAKTDAVSIGTCVKVTDLNANHPDTFTILGAWDSEPDKGVVSYLTPLAQALMNKKIGEEAEFEMDGAKKRYRIDSIEAWQSPNPDHAPVTENAPSEPQPVG
jgi:transcription elongation GreA/GreB family factor